MQYLSIIGAKTLSVTTFNTTTLSITTNKKQILSIMKQSLMVERCHAKCHFMPSVLYPEAVFLVVWDPSMNVL